MEDRALLGTLAAIAVIVLAVHAAGQQDTSKVAQTDSGQTGNLTESAAPTPRHSTRAPAVAWSPPMADAPSAPADDTMLTAPAPDNAPTNTVAATKPAPTKPPATSAPQPAAPTQITVNGDPVEFSDAMPMTVNGRVLVPVQALAEQLGGTVNWRRDTGELEIDMPDGQAISLSTVAASPFLGDTYATVSGYGQQSPYAMLLNSLGPNDAALIEGRAYMPVDALAAVFGAAENYDQTDNTVTFNLPDSGSQ